MTDYHIHIGQCGDLYHDSETVFSAVKERGTDEIYFSPTTSCRYCNESIDVQGNAELQKELPSTRELYELIHYEVQEAFASARKIGINAHALYWVVPEIHFSNATTVEHSMSEIAYDGFKLHPRANHWDLSNERTMTLAEEVFDYAEKYRF